jgi:hypothetical protein
MNPVHAHGSAGSPAVLDLLLESAFLRAVVLDASLGRALPSMSLPAAKRTPQIRTAPVTRIGDEVDAALPASGQTPA